ncbi:DUF2213 domain-containing protein [Psychrobacter sp. ANT_WB68]|uniref:DUF2213 domain-containing protein n=1 Tax=Psychrobacter sp. ANT_WB68 TaxID=2597355 RepID=UPI0011F127AC|nr:DUF2213 domain-containing protein [Psychrobacter sp. ANT_WB68]KAA0915805.1 DUF2213 domain-containing protein [Psychrobacter sp. ANT_WB68]
MKIRINQVIDLKPTSRIKTPQGFMICKDVTLAKPMVKEYYAGELGIVDGYEATDIINIYTPPDVLFGQPVIDGFTASDVVMQHPKGNQLTSDNYKEHVIGIAKNVRADNGYLIADLTIKDKWAIEAIEYEDSKQISLGYAAELDMTAGSTETGQAYHGQWVSMVADHVAVVREGRCGDDCKIGDRQTVINPEAKSMKVKIGNLEFDVGDNTTLAQAITAQSQELDALKGSELKVGDQAFSLSELTATQATIDKLVADNAALTELSTELEAKQITTEQIESLVADRVATISNAKKLNDKIVTDGKSSEQIRRDVITAKADDNLVKAIVGDSVVDADQSAIDTAFKALLATADSKQVIAADSALNGLNDKNVADGVEKPFDKTKMWEGAK